MNRINHKIKKDLSIDIRPTTITNIQLNPKTVDFINARLWDAEAINEILSDLYIKLNPEPKSEDIGNGITFIGLSDDGKGYMFKKDGIEYMVIVETWESNKMMFEHALRLEGSDYYKNKRLQLQSGKYLDGLIGRYESLKA